MNSIAAALILGLWVGLSCFIAFWWKDFREVVESPVGRICVSPFIGLIFTLGTLVVLGVFYFLIMEITND